MNCIGAILYDTTAAVSKSTTAILAMTAIDTANLRMAFTIPTSGKVRVHMGAVVRGATTFPSILLGVMNGAGIVCRKAPKQTLGNTAVATAMVAVEIDLVVPGLTPGAVNWDAAYGVETLVGATALKYGGPNDTTNNNAFGAFFFEVWDAAPEPANFGLLAIDASGRVDIGEILGTAVVSAGTVTFPAATLASTTNITAGTVTTATNVTTVNGLAANVITATSINADAITAAKIADGAIDAATFAAGAITATVIANGAIDAATFAAGAIDAAAIATGAIDADAVAADAATEIANAVWDTDATGRQTQGTFGQAIGDPVADTNTIFKAVVTDAAGATVGVDVVAVKAETASIQTDTNDLQTQIGTAGAGLTAIDLPDQTMNITGNITGNLSGTVGSVTGAVGSVTGLTASDVGAIKTKTDFLPSATAGSAGGVFIAGSNAATSVTTALTANITGNVSGSVGSVTGNVGGNVVGSVGSVTGLTASNLDATVSSRLATAGYTAPDNASIAAILVDTGTTLDGKIDTIDTVVDAVKVQTDKLAFTVSNQVDANVQSVNDVTVTGTGAAGDEWGPV